MPTLPHFSDITITNSTGTNAGRVLHVDGLSEAPITGLALRN